jgi:predicted enzyme related to lactoylglutathione lyase
MIKVNEIAFVGYPVSEQKRARDFYEGLLNLKPTVDFTNDAMFWVEYDLGANTLAISDMWKPSGQSGPCVALEVDDFPSTIETLKSKGIPFVEKPIETAVCHLAVITDPDGNQITIHKRKPGHG